MAVLDGRNICMTEGKGIFCDTFSALWVPDYFMLHSCSIQFDGLYKIAH